jgi:multiple sugar transport system substrate-binding protein
MVRSTRPDRSSRRRSSAGLVMAGCLLAASACSSGSGSSASSTSSAGPAAAATSKTAPTQAGQPSSKAAPTSGAATSSGGGPSEPAAPSTSKTKVTLSMVVQPFAFKNFSAVVDLYKTVNPNVTINLTQGGASSAEYIQGISTARLGGKVPDIFETFDVISDQMASDGLTEDLTPWLAKSGDFNRGQFADAFLASYIPRKAPSELHGLPVAADATVVFYNKKIFAESGVPLPTDNWSYATFLSDAQKISAAGKGKFWGVSLQNDGAVPPSIWQAQYQPMIKAYGGHVYDAATNTVGIGEPAAIQAWTQLLAPLEDGGAPSYGTVSGASAPTFAAGKYGMQISVRAQMPSYMTPLKADGWDVVQMPIVNGKHVVGGGSYGMAMAKDGKNKQAVWDFMTWFYSTHGGIHLLEDTYATVPPTKDGIANGTWKTLPAPPANVNAFGAAIADAVIAPALPGKSGAALDAAVLKAVQEVALQHVPIAKAFQEAEATVNTALKAEK